MNISCIGLVSKYIGDIKRKTVDDACSKKDKDITSNHLHNLSSKHNETYNINKK